MTNQEIIDLYLATIGKTWDSITAYERSVLTSFADELHQQLEAKTTLQPIPMVNGLDCPACGHPTLILGNGGYVTCSLEGCPNPDYAEAVDQKVDAEVERRLQERG